jgi:hypothetical protein
MRKSDFDTAAKKFGHSVFPTYLVIVNHLEEYHPKDVHTYFDQKGEYYFYIGARKLQVGEEYQSLSETTVTKKKKGKK